MGGLDSSAQGGMRSPIVVCLLVKGLDLVWLHQQHYTVEQTQNTCFTPEEEPLYSNCIHSFWKPLRFSSTRALSRGPLRPLGRYTTCQERDIQRVHQLFQQSHY
jgi:hypothetical protein